MGNSISGGAGGGGGTGKIVLSDGTLHQYRQPVTVAELMLEHPQQMVVEFDSKALCKRTAPLPADKKLEMNKVYVMIPMRRGKPAASILSSEEARRILLKANSILKSNSCSTSFGGGVEGVLPLLGKMCAARALLGGTGKNRNQEEERNKNLLRNYGGIEESRSVETTMMEEERGDELMMQQSLSRQISGKGWKPSLDTITEKTVHAKVRHWLF